VKYDRPGECCPAGGSHHQTQVNCEWSVDVVSLAVDLIGRRSHDVIGRLSLSLAAHVGKTSVNVSPNSHSQNYTHLAMDDHTSPTYDMTPGFKQFTVNLNPPYRKRWRLVHLPVVLSEQEH